MSLFLEQIITELADSHKPLLNSSLTELSNLDSENLEFFKSSWTMIDSKRRCQIVTRLDELAENNVALNFDNIFKYCLKDDDAEVRGKAVESLWENEEASLIHPLINLLEQDVSERVQAAAATALGKFVMLAEQQKLRSSYLLRLQEALLAATSDPNKAVEVRRRALEAIAPASLPEVKVAIMAAYQSHDFGLKVSSIYAMGKNCDPAWLSVLLKELTSTDVEIRYEAAIACGELEEKEAVPCLVRLIGDPDAEVQMTAIQALGKIGGTQAKGYLKACLNHSKQAIRQAAEEALDELETREKLTSFLP